MIEESYIRQMNQRIAATREAAEKQAKCPTCGAIRERMGRMTRFEDEIVRWLRETNAAASDLSLIHI